MPARSAARVPARRAPVPEDAVAAVFARAAELDLRHGHDAPATLLDEEALVEIGGAVGLSPSAVRQAVAEHHAGALVRTTAAPETWVGPRLAVAERRMAGDPDRVRRALERDLERQWFRKVRDQGERSAWAARTDLPARVARRVDLRHRLVLEGVSGLLLTVVACTADEVAVRLEADPAERRSGLGWRVAGAAAGGATVGAAILGEVTGIGSEPLLALPTGAMSAAGALAVARRAYLAQVGRLADDLEGTLDRLQRGR